MLLSLRLVLEAHLAGNDSVQLNLTLFPQTGRHRSCGQDFTSVRLPNLSVYVLVSLKVAILGFYSLENVIHGLRIGTKACRNQTDR